MFSLDAKSFFLDLPEPPRHHMCEPAASIRQENRPIATLEQLCPQIIL